MLNMERSVDPPGQSLERVYQACGWRLAGMSRNQSMAQVRRWEAQATEEESIPLHQAPGVHLSVPLLISEEHG